MIGISLVNLDGAINVANPPAGFTAASGNGSTDDAAAINAIFAALPIRGSYRVWFPRPAKYYKIGSTLWIKVSGTTVIWPQNVRVKVDDNATDSERTAPVDCWIKPASADLQPYVRIEDGAGGTIKHVKWYGGSIDGVNTLNQACAEFKFVNARHCEVVCFYAQDIPAGSKVLATSGKQSKFVVFRHTSDASKSGSASGYRHNLCLGYDPESGANAAGSVDCCGLYNVNGYSAEHGTEIGKGEDNWIFGGNMESGSPHPQYTRSGCARLLAIGPWAENYPKPPRGDTSGATSTFIGFHNMSTSVPGAVGFGWSSASLETPR